MQKYQPGVTIAKKRDNLLDTVCPLLDQTQHLVKLRREQVEGGQDAAVGTKIVPCTINLNWRAHGRKIACTNCFMTS
jgi:hypothetical protein